MVDRSQNRRRPPFQGCQPSRDTVGSGISEYIIWDVVRRCAEQTDMEHLAPHYLRRTCAKLCHTAGGEIEQIQFFLGHASVLRTEIFLGCKQNIEEPVNDRFGRLFPARTVELGKA